MDGAATRAATVLVLFLIGPLWLAGVPGTACDAVYDRSVRYADEGMSHPLRKQIARERDLEIVYPDSKYRMLIPAGDPVLEKFIDALPATYSRLRPSLAREIRSHASGCFEVRQGDRLLFRIITGMLIEFPENEGPWDVYGLNGYIHEVPELDRWPAKYVKTIKD
jgi:hypothetical protein